MVSDIFKGLVWIRWAVGDDRSGNLVPPGIYLSRVEVDVDSDSADRLLSVAY